MQYTGPHTFWGTVTCKVGLITFGNFKYLRLLFIKGTLSHYLLLTSQNLTSNQSQLC